MSSGGNASFAEEKKEENSYPTLDLKTDKPAFKQEDADQNEIEPRRTGRKRKSTTMIVQGHVVKTENNYVLKGHSYSHGAFVQDAAKVKKPKKPIARSKSVPKKRASYIDARMKHNGIIKEKMAKDSVARKNFMLESISALEPFLDGKVLSFLEREAYQRKHTNANAACAAKKRAENFKLGIQPENVTTTLRDYQMLGLEWMVKMHIRGMPMVLGDEMGLGKTLQTISLISYLKERELLGAGPTLVICPLSVLYSWCNEIKKHAPSLKCFRFHASDAKEKENQRTIITQQILDFDFIITTYEMAKSSHVQHLIRGTYFNFCVLDEGHIIKNTSTGISEAVRRIHSQNKIILTGTPLQNNLVELFAILNYLYPDYFTKPDHFASAFDIGKNRIDPDMLLKANKLLGLFMLRRLKEEVEKLMPKKIETKILCPLSSTQVFWYKGFLMNEIEALVKLSDDEADDSQKSKHLMLRNLIMQLRKCCLHPFMFDFAEADIEKTSVEELIATSGKLAVLDKVLRAMFKKGNRTVLFSQFTSMLNILEDYCVHRGWKYCRFDGSTPRAQRNHLINQFNAPGSKDFIFLMSTRSGGLGINLQTADTCILYDSDWNPQPDLQAMARVHRIGQKKTVHVYRLLSGGTVEERILERATKKLYLDQMVNRGGSSESVENDGSGLSSADLLDSLKFGSNAIFKSSNDLPTDSDIDTLTDRNRSENTSNGILEGGVSNSAKDFDKHKELTDTQSFGGVNFRKLRAEKLERAASNGKKGKFINVLKQEWKEAKLSPEAEMGRGKRERKSRIRQVDGMGSGYGNRTVPVLAMNDYSLENGEPSVWRETTHIVQQKVKRATKKHTNQDFCQVCGDGGELILCPLCPISMHSKCCGLAPQHFQSCMHHRCVLCDKSTSGAGGLLYPCESCPSAYCGDCLPKDVRFLGKDVPRFEELGFVPNNNYHYIHCSKQCENVAKIEFGFKPDLNPPKCPAAIDISYAFGANALSLKEIQDMYKGAKERPESPRKSPRKTPTRKSPRKPQAADVIIID